MSTGWDDAYVQVKWVCLYFTWPTFPQCPFLSPLYVCLCVWWSREHEKILPVKEKGGVRWVSYLWLTLKTGELTIQILVLRKHQMYVFLPHAYCQEPESLDHFNVAYIPSQLLGWRRQLCCHNSANIKGGLRESGTVAGEVSLWS